MRWRVLAAVAGVLLLAPVPWVARRGASRLEFFQLRAVQVEGVRYLDAETVLEVLGLDTTHSVWADTEPLSARLLRLPQVGGVDIRRKLPGTLVVSIQETVPVALAPTPTGLEPVDSGGVVLPIDPTREDLDLPIANQRDVPLLALLGAVRAGQPALYRRISEISRDGKTDFIMRLVPLGGVSPQASDSTTADSAASVVGTHAASRSLRVRAQLGVSVSRLADIFPVESDLLRRRASVAELDLRYRDQVIARLQ